MGFSFHLRVPVPPGNRAISRVALFPGAWNPPTVAHVAIARAALAWADEVIWTLPRAFPHKVFEGADFAERLAMLRQLAEPEPRFSVAVADRGLYVEIADEARGVLAPEIEIGLLCGRDAAERIAAWDYGRPGVFEDTIQRYPLLVASRAGDYLPDARHAARIVTLTMERTFDDVSSTEIRERLRLGKPWRHLAPDEIAPAIASVYAGRRPPTEPLLS